MTRPQVGIGILVVRDNTVLLQIRKGSHGAGQLGGPGGHLELGETFEECALRELEEECGSNLKVTEPQFLCLTNLRQYMPKHYADVGMVSHWISGEPVIMEPDKCDGWGWYDIDTLPDYLFGAISFYVEAYVTGSTYFNS